MTYNQNYNGTLDRVEYTDSGIRIPDKVVANTSIARSMYHTLRVNHLDRILLYAEIDGLLQGNPPYDQRALEEAGLGHIANFNTLEPRSLFEKILQSYWTLVFATESVINIEIDIPEVPQSSDFGRILSAEWTKVIKEEWRQFTNELTATCKQLVKYGVSPIMWHDERSPKWKMVELNKFYIPDRTKDNPEEFTNLFMKTEMSMVYLIEMYKHYSEEVQNGRENKSGWNLEELKWLIQFVANQQSGRYAQHTDSLDMQQRRSALDIDYMELYNENVPLVSLLYRENDGSITHYIFHEYLDNGNFLYSYESQYKSMDEAVIIFTRTPGDIYIHENKGIGHLIFPVSQAKIMLDNATLDMGRWASTPLISDSPNPLQSTEPIRFTPGVATNIGTAKIENNNMGSNMSANIAASQFYGNMLQQNLANSGDGAEAGDRSMASLSASQVRMKTFDTNHSMLSMHIDHFYRPLDLMYANMVSVMLRSKRAYPDHNISDRWKKRCMAKGVPELVFQVKEDEKLPEWMTVRATRVAGSGSKMARIIGLESLGPLIGSFGRREQEAYKREFITAHLGPEYVATFTQDSQDTEEIAGGASVAFLENNHMAQGEQALFSESNDHRAHIEVHLALLNDTIQQVSTQQLDVVQADRIFTAALPHTQQHYAALAANPFAQGMVEQLKDTMDKIQRYAVLNRRNAQKALIAQQKQMQEQQQQTQDAMSDQEIKNFVALQENQRAEVKVQQQLERQKEASDERAKALQKTTDAKVEAIRRESQAKAQADSNPPLEQSNVPAEVTRLTSNPTQTPFGNI